MCPRWKKIVNSSGFQPKPRHGHRAVPIKELMVIFGGGNEGMLADLIVYNTQTNHWFKPTVKGTIPAGRASYGMTIVDKTRIIMFGGMLEFMECTSEVFELQASRWEWRKLNPQPPPDLKPPPLPRLGHSFTSIGDKVYLFGGLTLDTDQTNIYPRYLNDFYTLEWSEDQLLWNIPVTYGNTPSPRESHSAVAHTDCDGNQRLIIYGGMSGRRLGDLWMFNVNTMTWSEVETSIPIPLPRSIHTATVVGDQMFVFGGWVPVTPTDLRTNQQEKEWKVTNQLLCLDLSSMIWRDLTNFLPKDLPKARAGHAAAEINGRIYIWSGRDGYRRAWNNQVCCNDLWFLDVDRPPVMPRPQLLKGDLNYLELHWPTVPQAEFYILQIQKYDIIYSSTNNYDKNSNYCLSKSTHLGDFTNHKALSNLNMMPTSNSDKKEDYYWVKSSLVSLPCHTQPHSTGKDIQALSPHSLTPISKLQVLATKSQPVIRKSTANEIPSTLPKTAFTYAVSKVANFSNQIPLLRPISMPMLKATHVKGTAEIGQKSFAVTRTTNLVRLNAPLPQVLKPQTFIVKNPGFKLVAVNKDSQIKLVPSQCSHVINKQNLSTPEKNIKKAENKLSPNVKDNTPENCPSVAKKVKLPTNSDTESCGSQDNPDFTTKSTPNKTGPINTEELKPPSFPEKVQIKRSNSTEGIFLSWTPPPGDAVTAYKVTLYVKDSNLPNNQKLIYNGVRPECFILKSHLDTAFVDDSGGTRAVKFTISARNSKGTGPALVVKWVLHPSHVSNT